MQKIELRIDVGAAVPLTGLHEVAMTAYLPSSDSIGPRPIATRALLWSRIEAWSRRVAMDCGSSPQ
jgi:hypothetical protein